MLVLVETKDLGSALLYFGIFLAMLYAATGLALFVAVGTALFVAGAAGAYETVSRVGERVTPGCIRCRAGGLLRDERRWSCARTARATS